MKKIFLLLLVAFSSQFLIAQNKFDTKKKISSGVPTTEVFEENRSNNKNGGEILIDRVDISKAKLKIIKDEGAVIYLSNPDFPKENKNARLSAKALNIRFLNEVKDELGIISAQDEFIVKEEFTDDLGLKHSKLQQLYKGVPIYGGQAYLHSDKSGISTFLTGKVYPSANIDNKPSISSEKALELVNTDLETHTIVQKNGKIQEFLALEKDKIELTLFPINNDFKLVYEIETRPNILERWVYFIDANNGEIVSKYNHTCTLDGVFKASAKDLNGFTQSLNFIQKGVNYYLVDPTKSMYKAASSTLPDKPVGAIWTIDAQNSRISDDDLKLSHVVSNNGTNWSPTSVSAHANASKCFDYYLSKFNRNSLNASGGNIISVINIADEDGKGLDNAYWNGQFMGYGNGQSAFKPLAGALDVAGHEMTHGVIENSAKLEYRGQSGALNESFADVFGVLIDRNNWTLGEDVVKTNIFPSGALRSMENPNQGGKNDNGYQPKNMSQYAYLPETPSGDNGGVHVNSGIPNHAFYKFATGSSMNKDKAEAVYYRALTTYMTRTSKFVDLRLAIIQSAKDIYGDGQEVAAAKTAFDFVGILDPAASGGTTPPVGTGNTNTNLPVNPGTESLVVFDPRPSDQSLYAGVFAANTDYQKITNGLGCLGKPSVTDDGSFVYFVGNDKHIYRVDLAKRNGASKLSDSPSWRNVAISKDGKQLAALASVLDNRIYVFDLVGGNNKFFTLKNPTYSTGISTGEVQYADSFEWDYAGENIIYDAFNQAKSVFSNIEYWDVGIIKVWDPANKTFGNGTIDKMFTNLDEGDNIGNPALAKTNSGILAFDYFSSNDDKFYVITVDLGKSSNNIKLIEENNEIGYPDFSKSDKVLVFNALNGAQFIVKGVNLAADKITKSGNSQTFFTDAKWAVWYAAGTRVLPTKENQTITISAISDQAPSAKFDINAASSANLVLNYSIVSGDASISGKTITLGTKPGKVVLRAFQVGNDKYVASSSEVSFCIIPPTPTLLDQGTTVLASGGTLFQFYVNNSQIGGQTTNATKTKDFPGSYSVRNATADGCLSLSSNIIGVAVLALEQTKGLDVVLLPNPVEQELSIKLPNDVVFKSLNISDLSGKLLLDSFKTTVNVESLSSGLFFVNVYTNMGMQTLKFVKK